MRYVLIPVSESAQRLQAAVRNLESSGVATGGWDALSQAFERTIERCELLVIYAVAIAGKPSKQ